MPTDNQPKVSMAMPVYNGDRHNCQAPNSGVTNISFPSLLAPLRSSARSAVPLNLVRQSCKHCYMLANIEQNYNFVSPPPPLAQLRLSIN